MASSIRGVVVQGSLSRSFLVLPLLVLLFVVTTARHGGHLGHGGGGGIGSRRNGLGSSSLFVSAQSQSEWQCCSAEFENLRNRTFDGLLFDASNRADLDFPTDETALPAICPGGIACCVPGCLPDGLNLRALRNECCCNDVETIGNFLEQSRQLQYRIPGNCAYGRYPGRRWWWWFRRRAGGGGGGGGGAGGNRPNGANRPESPRRPRQQNDQQQVQQQPSTTIDASATAAVPPPPPTTASNYIVQDCLDEVPRCIMNKCTVDAGALLAQQQPACSYDTTGKLTCPGLPCTFGLLPTTCMETELEPFGEWGLLSGSARDEEENDNNNNGDGEVKPVQCYCAGGVQQVRGGGRQCAGEFRQARRRLPGPEAIARACIVNETATPLMEVRPCPVPLDATGQRIISSQRLDKTMVLDGVEEEMLTPEP
ncbi:hypothetical protein PPROV_000673100 [Pycnococcus provasolii]|uniref:SREBP regulating gene protein n=3 Tax=Pycnococcus provasolii TaxID=41880 RepID=A0A830HSM6_9CHLO|nr:hypothetical protein PPROV_000673100 [Pycnococcus provasolii]